MNSKWDIEIPERFKKKLEARFGYNNAKKFKEICTIDIGCILCQKYYHENPEKCPFDKFKSAKQ